MTQYNEDISKKEQRRITKWLIGYTNDVYKLHEKVDGLVSKIKKENNNGNGNGNGDNNYYTDFLSFYQSDGVRYLLEKQRIIIADDMSVGKTAQAVAGKLEIENRYGKTRCLVVVPNDIKTLWRDRINDYCERPQKTVILDSGSYDEIEKVLEDAKDADFLIVNYNIFSNSRRNRDIADKLVRFGFNYTIFDEVHNAKNMRSVRSTFIKQVADSSEYLCLLSGTPIPNNLRDTYMLISLLDPVNYPTPDHARRHHQFDPGMIRAVLWKQLLRRKIDDVESLPSLKFNTQYDGIIELTPEQRQVYNAVYDNDELEGGRKIHELRKALLDPSLINPNTIFDPALRSKLHSIDSVKIKELDKLVEDVVTKSEKLVVFSPFYKKGVTKKLEERYKTHGSIRIDGDLDVKDRIELREIFQKDPSKKVLIATTATTGEGISLTAANNIVFLDEPYTPAARDQAIARVRRRGQTKPVNVISLAVKNTIDEGILELLKWKAEGIELLEKGLELDEKHLSVLLDEEYETTPIKRRLYTPQQIVKKYSVQMKLLSSLRGHEKLERELKKNDWSIAKQYAENYVKDWEKSYSGNTARAYKKIIEGLLKKGNLERKLDLGSGPGILSHVLNEPTVNVDINPKNFEQEFTHPKSKNIVSSFDNLEKELSNESFDLVVSSLSIDYMSNRKQEGKEKTERENALREANRVLKKNGYLIITLPYTIVDNKSSAKMSLGLSKLGFETVPELTGMVRSATDDADFQVYVSVNRKVSKPVADDVSKFLELSMPDKKEYVMRKKGVAKDFVFVDGNNKETVESRLEKFLERREA